MLISGLVYFLISYKHSATIILGIFIAQIFYVIFEVNYTQKGIFNFDKYYNNVKFEKKPNIYIFSFDGLAPEKLVKKYLRLDVDYSEKIQNKKFNVFQNAFSENVYTKSALNTLFFLDPALWRNKDLHIGPSGENSYFSGINEAPLHKILGFNNYKIATGYVPGAWSYQGKYSHEYNLNSELENIYPMYCRWQLPAYYIQLLYFCQAYENLKVKTDKKLKYFLREEIKNIKDVKDYNHYIDSINSIIKKSKTDDSWFFLQHIYRPGHTGDDYIHNEKNLIIFSQKYEKKLDETFNLINKLINTVFEHDKNSILLIISDHGPLLTKTKKIDLKTSKENLNFQILDKHAVFMGFLDNNGLCYDELKSVNLKTEYVTPTMVLNNLIKCLSSKNHLKSSIKYSLPYENVDLKEFLYE